jgi:hypothetical protein
MSLATSKTGTCRSVAEFLTRIRQGLAPRALRVFAAQGLLPVSREDLIRLLVLLSADGDAEIAEAAQATLATFSVANLQAVLLMPEVEPLEIDLIVRCRHDETLWEAAVRHPKVANETLRWLARIGAPRTQDAIVTNQTRLLGCLEVLDDLRANAGVSQEDVSVGDPLSLFPNQYYELLHGEFPNVHYIDHNGGSEGHARTKVELSTVPVYWSSRPEGNTQDYVPVHYAEARYLINMANLKSHTMAGVTLCAKNHFGSLMRTPPQRDYFDMHGSTAGRSPGTGKYRDMVDLIGHAQLGGKTLVYSSDTSPCDAVAQLARGADVLVHEGAGSQSGHSCPAMAGSIARQAGVGRLALIHYHTYLDPQDLIAEARSTYYGPITVLRDLEVVEL